MKPQRKVISTIAKVEPYFEPLFDESYKFFIANPNITTLILARDLIKKLEEDYGKPIFSNR